MLHNVDRVCNIDILVSGARVCLMATEVDLHLNMPITLGSACLTVHYDMACTGPKRHVMKSIRACMLQIQCCAQNNKGQ